MGKENVLLIPFDDQFKRIQSGYIDALECLGLNVIVENPKYKLNTKEIIEKCDLRYIILDNNCRYMLPIDINENIGIYTCDPQINFAYNHNLQLNSPLSFDNKILIITDNFDDHYMINIIRQLKINEFDFKIMKDNLSYEDISKISSLFQNIIVLSCNNTELSLNLAFAGCIVLSNTNNDHIENFNTHRELFDRLVDIRNLDKQSIKNKRKLQFDNILKTKSYCDIISEQFNLKRCSYCKSESTFDFRIRLEM